MMDVGMMLRNKHTGDTALIVETYNLERSVVINSKLSTLVYVLENEEGKRDNWNATFMKHWEIVKRKILCETEEEMLKYVTGDEEE